MAQTQVKKIDKKCKVIQKKDTIEIRCCNNSCKKTLVFVVDSKTSDDVLYNLSVQCPFCRSKSYDFPVYGNISWVAGDGVKIVNIQEQEQHNRVVWETSR